MSADAPLLIVAASDLHVGSTIGLCTPRVVLDDGGEYRASPAQRWLWRCWLDFCGAVSDTAERAGAQVVVVLNGDIVDGNHHRTTQNITQNETTMMRLAWDVLRPLVTDRRAFVIRGTEVHVGGSGRLEEKIAEDIGAECDGDNHSWWHLQMQAGPLLFDFAHHGSLGRLPWTRPNGVNRQAAAMLATYADTGWRLPNVVVRSHLHQYADTGSNYRSIRVISLPAWQLATAFVHRIAPGAIADIGGVMFLVRGGEYEVIVKRYTPQQAKAVRV